MPTVIGENVLVLSRRKYSNLSNTTARNRALAKDAETTLSQIQRVIAGEVAIGVDLVEMLAKAFGCRPQDLLTPYFASTMDGIGATPPAQSRDTAELQRPRSSSTPDTT